MSIRVGGVVNISLSPPMRFIEEQHGAFRARLQDLTGLWRRFSQTMGKIGQERFQTAGYGEWAPLAPSTLADKERHGFPFFPLIRTGELYQSLTEPSRAAAFSASEMTWGTDVPYAQYHQQGGTVTRRTTRSGYSGPGVGIRAGAEVAVSEESVWHLPQRKVLDIRVEDRRRLETDMVSWLNQTAAEAFGGGL